jgi:D-alanyl-lipoteichoic acid acyltransferase DltB (MBOAT superfamily)
VASAERARSTLDAASAPARARPDLAGIAAAALQLALLLLIVKRFAIEGAAFLTVALLAGGGFLVHAFLPRDAKLPFFALLSIAAIVVTLGPLQGAWLLGIGLALIGLCHAPVPSRARVLLVIAAGASLALARVDVMPVPWSDALWPILASMFMFRLIVYLYDLRHEKTPPNAWRSVAYFFMLPNVCFPLFPVVDYKTFRRTHLEGEERWVYQTGIHWMVRGVVHLVLYRLVYYNLSLDPSEVGGPADLARFLVTNFLLYLRVSGQFHLIVGMLHLFGFNLPETNRNYVLATGFTDFWRRINIYWKEFMMKIFYYPIYFRVKKAGPTAALAIATLGVFVITWALHSYQWFWLRGVFPVTTPDILFWGSLAVLVLVGSLREARAGGKRPPRARPRTVPEAAALFGKTAGTFAAICILWSLWTAHSVRDWLDLWRHIAPREAALLSTIPIAAAALLAAGTPSAAGSVPSAAAGASRGGPGAGAAARRSPRRFWRYVAATTLVACGLAALSLRPVAEAFGPVAEATIASLRASRLNRRDAQRMERGYYESLLDVNTFDSDLWQVLGKRRDVRPFEEEANAVRVTHDYLGTELIPSIDIAHHDTRLTTNRWGMRDRDYERERVPGTFRAALLGSSHVMGMGVADSATFENIVEERLNADRSGGGPRVELLNFAVGGYSPLEQIAVFEDRAAPFAPDALFYFGRLNDVDDAVRRLGVLVSTGVDLRYDFLRDIVARAGVSPQSGEAYLKGRLSALGPEILSGLYREIVAECRARGATPVWIHLPLVVEHSPPKGVDVAAMAREAGFTILTMAGAYDGVAPESIWLAEWDQHPNAAGHRLLADKLEHALRESPPALRDKVFASASRSGP